MPGPLALLFPPTMMPFPVILEGRGGCVKALLHLVLRSSCPVLMSPQAIAHYEQSADYYKGEESNR